MTRTLSWLGLLLLVLVSAFVNNSAREKRATRLLTEIPMPSIPFTVELLQTGPDQAELIRNLYQFYAYESSDWEQEDVEVDGRFYIHEEHLIRYWQEPQWSANLILVDGFIAGFLLIERSEFAALNALELADLFILKRYRRKGIGRAIASQVLMSGESDWLVRFYDQDETAQAFWRAVLDNLPRPVRTIELDDEPELLSYLVTRAVH
ncbi:GNAT family N-acetyltransferase [Pseudomonas alkylphenolica]|uniref:GCN5-like N-acetyltransferase n=2 Tax=Pseudomonas alkylphenolica TaxID=237609 RepID=A0A077FDZ7_9PSED|nr:GCN5-like N-acetyltransferase [Pseudomonas alkylphenolica]